MAEDWWSRRKDAMQKVDTFHKSDPCPKPADCVKQNVPRLGEKKSL